MKWKIPPLLMTFALLSCGGESDNNSDKHEALSWFDEQRNYRYLIPPFESEQECMDAQDPSFFINCYRWVELLPNRTVNLVITDVIHVGSFSVNDDVIEVTMPTNLQTPNYIEFYISNDNRELTLDIDSTVWSYFE